MENVIVKMFPINSVKLIQSYSKKRFPLQRYYTTNPRDIMKKPKLIHPYRKVHPWRSIEQFSKSLAAGVLHNEEGLVVINKPYGIAGRNSPRSPDGIPPKWPTGGIVHNVDYTITDALPHIANELGYPKLKLLKSPEKYMTGVTILVADEKVEKAIEKSFARAQGMNIIAKCYWAVTTRVPNEIKGEKRLAMKMQSNVTKTLKKPVIITSWSENEQKRREVKLLNVQFKLISNSTENLSSLLEIKSSTIKWHALRLFASTVLYSPMLGDNIHGSRVKNVMGQWMNVSPFVDVANDVPRLNKELLEILKLSPGKEEIIPVHLHLREIYLPMYRKKDSTLTLVAPPMPEFMWTCRQLQFKHELFDIDEEIKMPAAEESDSMRIQAVT